MTICLLVRSIARETINSWSKQPGLTMAEKLQTADFMENFKKPSSSDQYYKAVAERKANKTMYATSNPLPVPQINVQAELEVLNSPVKDIKVD